jgi:hypothetical protein
MLPINPCSKVGSWLLSSLWSISGYWRIEMSLGVAALEDRELLEPPKTLDISTFHF